MGFSEIENAEQKLKMNPAVAEIGGSYEFKPNGSTKHAGGVSSLKLGHFPYGLCNKGKKKLLFSLLTVSLVLNVILIVLSIVFGTTLSGRSCEVLPLVLPSPSTTEFCPDGWIVYQRKCYYFSDSYKTWNDSQKYCASFNASLVVINSPDEMSFLRRYKGSADHWIGLQRNDDQEPWKWINGTIFNKWFEIRGRGEVAYINRQGIASSSGQSEENWICSKPVHLTKGTG